MSCGFLVEPLGKRFHSGLSLEHDSLLEGWYAIYKRFSKLRLERQCGGLNKLSGSGGRWADGGPGALGADAIKEGIAFN